MSSKDDKELNKEIKPDNENKSVNTVNDIDKNKESAPSQTAQAAGQGQTAGPAQTAGPTQAVGPTQTAGPTQAAGQGQAAGPTQAAGSTQTAGPAQAAGSAQSNGHAQTAGQAEPGNTQRKKMKKLKIALVVMSIILVILISVPIISYNILLNRIGFVTSEETYTVYKEGEITDEKDVEETPLPSGVEPTLHPYEPDPSKPPQYPNNPPSDKDIINILLIGVEKSRPTENGRSDTMIIATLDKKNKQLKMTSILRDNYVYIPGNYLNNRINAAHSFGNVPLLLKTINTNFNLDLEKYVSIDFQGFVKIMERIGEIELDLTKAEAERVFGAGHEAGRYKLNPEQALSYSRFRKLDSDFRRTQRQRNVLVAIYNKCMKQNPLTLYSILYDIFPYVKTNLTKGELGDLMMYVATMGKKEIKEMRVPVEGTYKNATIRGMLVLVPDVKANADAIRKFIYGS